MDLELAAMRWLWIDKKCLVVLEERTPFYSMGQPDVLGVTPGRYLVEIEIKRSLSDFRADLQKIHRLNRFMNLKNQPRQFYYLADKNLAPKLVDKVPDWAGLMMMPFYPQIEILKIAPVNEASVKLNLKQCTRLSRMMTSHMLNHALTKYERLNHFRQRDDLSFVDWTNHKKGTYQI